MRATGYSTQSKTTGWVVHMLRDSSRALALLSISTNTQDLIPDSPFYIQYNSHNCSSENFEFNQTKFLRWYFSFFFFSSFLVESALILYGDIANLSFPGTERVVKG